MRSSSDNEAFRVSPHVALHRVGPSSVAAWNRYSPSVAVLDDEALPLMGNLEPEEPVDAAGIGSADALALLEKKRLVFRGTTDSSGGRFFRTVRRAVDELDRRSEEARSEARPYASLTLFTTTCNLGCPYCIASAANKARATKPLRRRSRSQQIPFVLSLVDQYLDRKLASDDEEISIGFNGGETLLAWPLVHAVVEHVGSRAQRRKLKYSMNTNLTLLTKEMAELLARHRFSVSISIDGYQQVHDQTRRYPDGRGSFADVIEHVRMFNGIEPEVPIKGFQGTIHEVEGFDAERLFRMCRRGFEVARMSPNLLGVSEEDGRRKADLSASLFETGTMRKLAFIDRYHRQAEQMLNRPEYGFSFICNGLSCYPKPSLGINVDSEELTLLCSFIPAAAVSFSKLDGDIHSPLVWQKARAFIRERMHRLQEECAGCEIIGVCRGSCIQAGLDIHNRRNPGACAFQRRMWQRMLELSHRHQH